VIAVSLVEGKGGGFFDTDVRRIGNQIAVYDLSSRERVLTVDVVPLPKNAYDFALSPDGSKLAILNDRKVSVCSVPAQSPAH
jgi:Tol biopolymer transport system component